MKVLTIEARGEKKPIKKRKPKPRWKRVIYKLICWIEDHDIEMSIFGTVMLMISTVAMFVLLIKLLIMILLGVQF